ncbi:MAG TPA: response regulator [Candidatus Eisenbacteria bacterium]|nr:response regulator [Candidatus Eisenbacteria bacterium]
MASNSGKSKILIVDDDNSMRGLLKARLSDLYDVVDTGDPEQALGLALEHKPVAILLDLMMPKFSGFELCQNLHSLSYTSRIPIFMVTGESAAKYKQHCQALGAKDFFEKPVNFALLRERLVAELQENKGDRRAHVRVRMRVVLKLTGTDAEGKPFEQSTFTENVSVGGFLSGCTASLIKGARVRVFLTTGGQDHYAGTATVVRRESPGAPWQRYGFHFEDITSEWVLQP